MKRKIISVFLMVIFALSGCLVVFATEGKISADVIVDDEKPIIFQRDDTVEPDGIMDDTIMSVTFEHDGKVYYKRDENLYYMKGWSTAKGSTGVDLYHYTTADFATFFLGFSFGAVTEWGVGKVWATSEDVGWEVYDSTYGRIKYGL